MKKAVYLLTLLLFLACKNEVKKEPLYPKVAQTPEQLGKEIFEDKGNCAACHQPNQKVIGPSIQDIAKIYKDKKASIVTFLKGNAEPLVDPSQFDVMKTNFAITKTMSDEELQAIETYIYSNLK
jgi:cytochrome c